MAKANKEPQKEQANAEVQVEAKETTEQESGTISTSVVSTSASKPNELIDDSLVSVKIEYPKNYEGAKYFIDGEVYEMSRESADEVIKQGIAKEC